MSSRGHRVWVAVACVGALTLAGCDLGGGGDGASRTDGGAGAEGGSDGGGGGFLGLGGDPDPLVASLLEPAAETTVLPGSSPEALATGMTGALVASAPVVVLAAADEGLRAASAAVALGVPVVVDGSGAAEELQRLGAEVALTLGPVADPGIDVVVPGSDEELADLLGLDGGPVPVAEEEAAQRVLDLDPTTPELLVPAGSTAAAAPPDGAATTAPGDGAASTAPPPLSSDRDELPPTLAPQPTGEVTVLTDGDPAALAALGTARAAGARVLVGPHTDPRADSGTVQALAGTDGGAVLGLGDGFGGSEDLAWKVDTARTGVELPGGGQLVLPGKTYVALYGTPSTGALGVLGEQPVEETIARAEEHAGWYADLTDEPVIPTHEIIVTVASAGPGGDGNYSEEIPVADLEPLVDLAEENGHYVVLDLQPGRTDFRTQAELYEELLLRPHVGLALDPEWRIGPDEVHLVRIGHVEAAEVNEVMDYLADLTRENDLPQKVLVLHMFQNRMIPDVEEVDRSREELAVLIHVDGQGAQPDKQTTWRTLRQHAPSIEHWGWKNFYDEDVPMLSAEETMRLVEPTPDFISYQ